MVNLTRWVCVVYWSVLTVGLLLPGGGNITDVGPFAGYPDLAHFAAFVVLACLVRLARWPWSIRFEILVLMAHAVGTELGQYLVPGRTPGFLDGLANVLGVLVGMVIGEATVKLLKSCAKGGGRWAG